MSEEPTSSTDPEVVEYEEAVRAVRMLEPLLASEGWMYLRELLAKQASARARERGLLKPLSGFEEMFSREFKAGEEAGIRLSLSLPEAFLEQSKVLRAEYEERIANIAKRGDMNDD